MFSFQDNTAPPPLEVKSGDGYLSVEDVWKRIVVHDEFYYVYLDRKKRLLCAREGTTRQVLLEERLGIVFVGRYNAAIRKSDFIDDVQFALGEICRDRELTE